MNRVSQSGISLALPKTVDDEKSFDFQQRPNGLDLLGLGLWSYGVDCADSASLSGLSENAVLDAAVIILQATGREGNPIFRVAALSFS